MLVRECHGGSEVVVVDAVLLVGERRVDEQPAKRGLVNRDNKAPGSVVNFVPTGWAMGAINDKILKKNSASSIFKTLSQYIRVSKMRCTSINRLRLKRETRFKEK